MFCGSIVALITPYKDDLSVDFETLRRLVRLQLGSGTSGIVALGTTGEHLLLTDQEKRDIIKTIVEEVAGEIPVIVNVGVAATRVSLQNAKEAKVLGADGILVVTPYYVKPNELGVVSHIKEVAKCGLPIMFYYHPGRTGVDLSLRCVEEIVSLESVFAMKDATNNLGWINQLQTDYFAGDDSAAVDVIRSGGKGVVSVVANIFPEMWARGIECGDEMFRPLLSALSLETNPQCIKYAMSRMGLCSPVLRLPLVEPSKMTKAAIDTALSNSFTSCLLKS